MALIDERTERVLADRMEGPSRNEMVQSVEVGSTGDSAQVRQKRNSLYSKMKDQVVQNLLEYRDSVEERTESDDEDEEDVDFNPFLQRSPSPEASSGLSSENEDLDEENGITEGENLEPRVGDAFQNAKGKAVLEHGSENDNEEVQDDDEHEEDENSEEETEQDDKDDCMEQEPENNKAMVELCSENDNEEVADNEEEEGEKNEEDTDRDGREPGNLKHLNGVNLAMPGNAAIVGLENGDLEEGAQIGCKSKMIEPSEQHQRRMCALELGKEGTIPQQTEVEMTFAVLSDLRSSPGKLSQTLEGQKDQSDEEEQVVDAICKRTRAQYSLADMSLDELETFLQGSDEEDYFQNVDDEEEYRKFVAAVQGQLDDGTGVNDQDGGKEEEEDEEDDYDFELEIEEALESDYDETSSRKSKRRVSGRRPETREKRRHIARPQSKERLLGLAKVPLRPLLPSMPCKDSVTGANKISEERSSKRKSEVNGFTADQIQQLQCLIHEHVQLLVQVFSLSILEPSRQQIAVDTHRLLMQLVEKRNEVVAWKKTAFPQFCFCPSCVFSSTSFEQDKNSFQPERPKFQDIDWRSSFNVNVNSLAPSGQSIATDLTDRGALTFSDNVCTDCNSVVSLNRATNDNGACVCPLPPTAPSMSFLEKISSSVHCLPKSQRTAQPATPSQSEGFVSQGAIGSSPVHLPPNTVACVIDRGNCVPRQKTGWAPVISGPVYSLLDVAPLALVKDFVANVDQAVQEYRQHHIQSGTYHGKCGWEPLFQVAHPDLSESEWSMAAPLVEAPQRKRIALVPKEISIVVGRFAPLFNPDLFPHQPPPAASANRIFFTEAEDELLAMGLMRYNTNWNAIQQNLLPSKTTHQIFVRQKNRSSGRAPENSIKAVRRLKASPLTKEEKDCIEEGLNLYKLDWMKVWKYCVPHRDPATLPRQWRVAVGTQESHKICGKVKGKHRISEAKRQQEKDVSTTVLRDGDAGEVNNGDETCGANDVNLHGALSTAWMPHSCQSTSATFPVAAHPSSVCNFSCSESKVQETTANEERLQKNLGERNLVNCSVVRSDLGKIHVVNPSPSGGQSQPTFAWTPISPRPSTYVTSSKPTSDRFLRKHHHSWSYRSLKKGVQTVKLAPGLPSLNLPPCVRVIPQSKLDSSHPLSSRNFSNVISQCKCLGSSQNQKCSLAVPSSASSHPSKPLPGSKADLLFSDNNNRELKHAKSTNAGDHQSMPCHKSKCGSISSPLAYGWSPLKKNPSTCRSVGSFKVPDSHGANVISDVQTVCVKKPPWVKMHPLLMQCSLGSEAVSKACCHQMPDRNGNVGECQCKVLVGKPQQRLLQQRIPQFQACFGAAQNKGMVNSGQSLFRASSFANASSAVGTAELHPFLQEEDEHQPFLIGQVRGMINPPLSAQKHISGGRVDVGVMQQPSVLIKSIIRPAPVLTIKQQQERQQQGEHLEPVHGPSEQSTSLSCFFHKTKRHKNAHKKKPVQKLVTCKNKSKGKSGFLEPEGEEISTNIVMEQEELSDSDDEMEEQVQFECEEMVDSDKEGSEHEQHVTEPDEEDEGIKFDEEEIGSDDSDNGGGDAGRCDSIVRLVEDGTIAGGHNMDTADMERHA